MFGLLCRWQRHLCLGQKKWVFASYICVFVRHKCVLARHRCVFASHITVLFSMTFGCAEHIISASETKFDVEADGEVHFSPNPQKTRKICKRTIFSDWKLWPNLVSRRKMKHRESSETNVDKFSLRTEPISRGERPFKVSKNFRICEIGSFSWQLK